MAFLQFLEGLRMPWLNEIMNAVTLMGDETFFTLVGLAILWCASKKWGLRMLMIGVLGTAVNQLLKVIFCIPRPWLIQPELTIVESARAGADGYSFPSGHTQSAVSIFGTLALWLKKRWVTAACVAATLLIAFSRMYLGVHTPLDVGVALAAGVLIVCVMVALLRRAEGNTRRTGAVLLGMLALMALMLPYFYLAPMREGRILMYDLHGLESMWKLLGCGCGMVLAWWLDVRYIRFETSAPLWAQAVKLLGGTVLVLGVQVGMKPVLSLVLGQQSMLGFAIRYFLVALVGAGLWPMCFRFFPARRHAGAR